MRLTVDNHDGQGARDYTAWLAATPAATLVRRLNQPAQMKFSLLPAGAGWVAPASGARVVLAGDGATSAFSGYLATAPRAVFTGMDQNGPVYRWDAEATSDEWLLDRRMVADREPYVGRTAGDILTQMTTALLPGSFATSAVADGAIVPSYATEPAKTWSEHAAELATLTRSAYRVQDGAVCFQMAGENEYALDESDPLVDPSKLAVWPAAALPRRHSGIETPGLMNDVSVVGASEPAAHVKDYLVGDGVSLSFKLSNTPFLKYATTWLDDEFLGTALDARRWQVVGNAAAVTVSGGKLVAAGGGVVVQFAEQMELGGALLLQHGRVEFSGPSSGLVGALCSGGTDQASTLAGFACVASGTTTQIQAVVGGALTGTPVTVTAGWQYLLTTRIYTTEVYRQQPSYCSSAQPQGHGGDVVADSGHVVLEVHAVDPANPATQVAVSQILFDGKMALPARCTYVLLNATSLACCVDYSAFTQAAGADVQSTYPGAAARTRLVGALSDGGECDLSSTGYLCFYSAYVPAPSEAIKASYRAAAWAMARVQDAASVAANASADDDGVRAGIRQLKLPAARTSAECELAALAVLDDATQTAWAGSYETYAGQLPGGAADLWPGDGVHVTAATRGADFHAVVREVTVEVEDAANGVARYKIGFANDAAAPLGFTCQGIGESVLEKLAHQELAPTATTAVGSTTIADLPLAEMTALTSTTFTIDVGCDPPAGGGIEVRRSDAGWGAGNDRNLAGQFTTRSFTLPRLARVQTYYLRQYDSSGRYSRYTTVLHADYPL
jgi:hypothetical protein